MRATAFQELAQPAVECHVLRQGAHIAPVLGIWRHRYRPLPREPIDLKAVHLRVHARLVERRRLRAGRS